MKKMLWFVLVCEAAFVLSLTSCPAPGGTSSEVSHTGWKVLGAVAGFSAGEADYLSLAVDSANGTPYLAYVDHSMYSGYPDVRKFAGGTWASLGDAGDSG